MKKIFLGASMILMLLLVLTIAAMAIGLFPVNADGPHFGLEARIMPWALHASVARHASGEKNPVPLSEDRLKAAAGTYEATCASCHGTPGHRPSRYGQSFYPPAPPLDGGMSKYSDSQLYSLIKHGIRNTGMPAWGTILEDDQIWELVSLLKNSQDLPPSVEQEWGAKNKDSESK